MRIAIAAIALALLAGCSTGPSRDESAYLDAALARASDTELVNHNAADFLNAGDIACQMSQNGNPEPDGTGYLTGISWSTVWEPALEFLCP